MSCRRLIEVLPSLIVAIVAAAYVWQSYDYDLASQTLPWIAGVMAMTLALIDIVSKPRGTIARQGLEPAPAAPSPLQEAVVFAWIGAFLGLVVILGFYAAMLLYVFCYLKIYASKNSVVSAVTAFCLSGFLYLVFEVLMGYEIFGGLIAGNSL